MGKILKKEASVVQYEKDVQDLESQINVKEKELNELAKDMSFSQMFDDTAEIDLIKSSKDALLLELADLQQQLEELKANEKV